MAAPKQIYRFHERSAQMRDLLGGKGANLCEMARLGLPVPPGLVITTEACLECYQRGRSLPKGLWGGIRLTPTAALSSSSRRLPFASAQAIAGLELPAARYERCYVADQWSNNSSFLLWVALVAPFRIHTIDQDLAAGTR